MANNFGIAALVCFILSGLFLVLTIFLYIKLDILYVINFLTGKVEAKGIEKITVDNKTDNLKRNFDVVDYDDKDRTGNLGNEIVVNATSLLNNEKEDDAVPLPGLDTTILSSETLDLMQKKHKKNLRFTVKEEILIVHTDKVI